MNNIDNETYRKLVENSTKGRRSSAKPSKTIKVKKDQMKKALVSICCTCVIFGALATSGIKSLINTVSDSFEIMDATNSFKVEAINENTHRTNDMQHYWYDYDKIADHIETEEDVYLLYQNLGEEQSNKVLACCDNPTTIEDFIKDHDYKDKKDWIKTSNKKILLQNEITKKQNELADMQADYEVTQTAVTTNSNEMGGK